MSICTVTVTPTTITITGLSNEALTIKSDSPLFPLAHLAIQEKEFDRLVAIVAEANGTQTNTDEPPGINAFLESLFGSILSDIDSLESLSSDNDCSGEVSLARSNEQCIPALNEWEGNGSPIYYLTKEMAQEQVEASRGFWSYHDFGLNAKPGRRYATVPTHFGPTAPTGYEWACVPIED